MDVLGYRNVSLDKVSSGGGGGVLQKEVSTAAYVTSVPCRGCSIINATIASASTDAYFNINGTATVTTAIIPCLEGGYLPLKVASLSCLNLYAAATVTVCIVYDD